jgi:hypothetical protein
VIRPKTQMLAVSATSGSGRIYAPAAKRPYCALRPSIARKNVQSDVQRE